MKKSWKLQIIIATVQKLFNYYAHSCRGFADAVQQMVLFPVLWFKWSVKKLCVAKHCVAKVLLGIWEILLGFLHENILNYNYPIQICSYPHLAFFYKSNLESGF